MTGTLANPLRPPSGAPRPYRFPDFERRELTNGMRVWMVPLPGATMTNVHLVVDAGAASEDEAHAGVAALTAQPARHRHATARRRRPSPRRPSASGSRSAASRAGTPPGPPSSRSRSTCESGIELLAEMVRDPRLDPGRVRSPEGRAPQRDPPGCARSPDAWRTSCSSASSSMRRRPTGGCRQAAPEAVEALSLDDVAPVPCRAAGPRPRATSWLPASIDTEAVMRAAQMRFGDWDGSGSGHRSFVAVGARRPPGRHRRPARIGAERAPRRPPRASSAWIRGTSPRLSSGRCWAACSAAG